MVIGKKEALDNGKRGEISSEQTIRFVVPILTFLIVLGFLGYLGFKGTSQEDLCKLSVLSRGTSPESASALIPLKCTTKKVCLTFGKGKCEESFAGYDDVEVVKLPNGDDENSKNKAAKIIEEVSAEEMYRCWQSMGEGKIDLFGSYAKSRGINSEALSLGIFKDQGVIKPTCVICGRVATDNSIKDDVLKKVDVHRYMKENKVPDGSITYLQAFTDEGITSYSYVSKSIFDSSKIEKPLEGDNIREINTKGRELALVFMQIKSERILDAWKNLAGDGLLVAGGSFMISPIRASAPKILSFTATKILGIGIVAGLGAHSALNVLSGQTLAAGYCGAFATTPEIEKASGSKGCSIVEAVPYDYRAINSMCEIIEGNP